MLYITFKWLYIAERRCTLTVSDAVERSSAIYPGELDGKILYSWLSELEDRICRELLDKESPVISESDGDRVLSAPDGYAEIYPLYLVMKRELTSGNTERYNCYAENFNLAYKRYGDYVCRNRNFGNTSYKFPGF